LGLKPAGDDDTSREAESLSMFDSDDRFDAAVRRLLRIAAKTEAFAA
jgi:hypothetical protein